MNDRSAARNAPDKLGTHMRENGSEWTYRYHAYFWHSQPPFQVKLEVEKVTHVLLHRDVEETSRLVFEASARILSNTYRVRLRLEAATPARNLYSLSVDAAAPCQWVTESGFRGAADRVFAQWIRGFEATTDIGALETASEELYEQLLRDTRKREAEFASRNDDSGSIRAVQQSVLGSLRQGRSFLSTHPGGGSCIYFNGEQFVKMDFEETRTTIDTSDQMLAFLRIYFEREATEAARPHNLPELDVWKYIEGQLTA